MKNYKTMFAMGVITITLPFGTFVTSAPATSQGQPPAAVNAGVGANTSFNWAGYEAEQGGDYTSISGTWTVPPVPSATSTMADATWVGIGGVTSHDLIQAGTQAVTNHDGSVSYQAWYETLPQSTQPVPFTVSPGDSVSASITESSANEWLVSLRDNTTGQSYQTTLQYQSSLSSAEWIEEMPSDANAFLPLDNFGSVSFVNGMTVQDGNTLTVASSGAQPLTMVNSSGQALASVSPLGSDGQSFTATRTSLPATPASRVYYVQGGRGWRRTGVGMQGYGPRTRRTSTTTTSVTIPSGTYYQVGGGYQQLMNLLQQLQQLQTQFHESYNGFIHGRVKFGF